jgi:prolyl-tRNA synthetase
VSYDAHRVAYQRIFDRIGMDYRIAFAVSGAMGGSASEEFLAPSAYGEDAFVQCADCDYTANTEAVEIAVPPKQDPSSHPESRLLDTPDTPTIDSLVARLDAMEPERRFTAADTLKNVVLKTRAPGSSEWELLVVGVPGDREVDLKRVAGQLEPTEVATAEVADFAGQPRLVRGYIGPQVLAELGIRYVVDPVVVPGSAWVTGANHADQHAADVVRGRDFEPAGELGAVEIRDGDRCARCGGELSIARGIEIGHVFQLGRKFTDAFGLDAQGPDGEPIRITMGSYGVGVSRAVAAVAEQTLDDAGLCWPAEIAPYDVHLVPVGRGDEQLHAAEALAGELEAAGRRVLLGRGEVR